MNETLTTPIRHATLEDYNEIWEAFKPHLKTYFPHIRTDYLKRKIEAGEVVLCDSVVITYGIYQRKQKIGVLHATKGDCHIGQITTNKQGSGSASRVLQEFFKHVNTNVWLTVRADNDRARKFYEKNGMKNVGEIFWMAGTLPGTIYKYENDGTRK